MSGYDPGGYGEAHAEVYDRIYPAFPTDLAVARIAALAADRDGPILDLGIGTGRLACPLRQAGRVILDQFVRALEVTRVGRLQRLESLAADHDDLMVGVVV